MKVVKYSNYWIVEGSISVGIWIGNIDL